MVLASFLLTIIGIALSLTSIVALSLYYVDKKKIKLMLDIKDYSRGIFVDDIPSVEEVAITSLKQANKVKWERIAMRKMIDDLPDAFNYHGKIYSRVINLKLDSEYFKKWIEHTSSNTAQILIQKYYFEYCKSNENDEVIFDQSATLSAIIVEWNVLTNEIRIKHFNSLALKPGEKIKLFGINGIQKNDEDLAKHLPLVSNFQFRHTLPLKAIKMFKKSLDYHIEHKTESWENIQGVITINIYLFRQKRTGLNIRFNVNEAFKYSEKELAFKFRIVRPNWYSIIKQIQLIMIIKSNQKTNWPIKIVSKNEKSPLEQLVNIKKTNKQSNL